MERSWEALLVLADGRTFRGRGFGARRSVIGEVVFNTALTGYQEILTDPSYHSQIVCMTQPHIGVYGTNSRDPESRGGRVWAAGLIVREASDLASNRLSERTLPEYLQDADVPGITGIDTRALTRHIRDCGAMAGVLAPAEGASPSWLHEQVLAWGTMEGRELVSEVTCAAPYTVDAVGTERFCVGLLDFGIKQNIVRRLTHRGIRCRVYPAATSAAEILAENPDAIVLSNGPGDPAACQGIIAAVRDLLGEKPIFGICLGHQLLGLAVGAETYKLPFGHHGANHPVKNLSTGRIEITSQNHGFAVDPGSLRRAGAVLTHVNLNDGTVEGLALPEAKASSVQYHPEAAPGPHDADYLFDELVHLIESN